MAEPITDEQRAQAHVDAAWQHIARAWDIEPREYFEREAPRNGFEWPLVQAIHHIWKRNPRVVELEAALAREQARIRDYQDTVTQRDEIIAALKDEVAKADEYSLGAANDAIAAATAERDAALARAEAAEASIRASERLRAVDAASHILRWNQQDQQRRYLEARIVTLEAALRGVKSTARGYLCWCDNSWNAVEHSHQPKCLAASAALTGGTP